MATKSEEYRRKAAEFQERAKEAKDFGAQRAYDEVAKDWLRKAEDAERRSE